jgi:uncharacterized membrane protein (UPF0182 family)
MRLAAALAYTDRNVLLTGVLTRQSRMMINRNVRQRVAKLADFLEWDSDPYLVVNDDGKLRLSRCGRRRQRPASSRFPS